MIYHAKGHVSCFALVASQQSDQKLENSRLQSMNGKLKEKNKGLLSLDGCKMILRAPRAF